MLSYIFPFLSLPATWGISVPSFPVSRALLNPFWPVFLPPVPPPPNRNTRPYDCWRSKLLEKDLRVPLTLNRIRGVANSSKVHESQQVPVARKPVNPNRGLKFNQGSCFFYSNELPQQITGNCSKATKVNNNTLFNGETYA